ncbi:hypothetical protein O0L34_g19225 [Tuta absoluta]|nr:hypothetical protein O0L34_g19225 [Tuta absoluta]
MELMHSEPVMKLFWIDSEEVRQSGCLVLEILVKSNSKIPFLALQNQTGYVTKKLTHFEEVVKLFCDDPEEVSQSGCLLLEIFEKSNSKVAFLASLNQMGYVAKKLTHFE